MTATDAALAEFHRVAAAAKQRFCPYIPGTWVYERCKAKEGRLIYGSRAWAMATPSQRKRRYRFVAPGEVR